MVADSSHPAQQVLNCTPPQPVLLFHREVLPERRTTRLINIGCPITIVRIGAGAESRQQIKFKMVVRIDESGKNQISRQIDNPGIAVRSGRADLYNASVRNFYICVAGLARAE